MQSLDGKRELILLQDHSAKLRGQGAGPEGDGSVGTWAFDEVSKRYLITFGGEEKLYTIVQPENSEVCILVRGKRTSADMTESWYGRTLEDLQDGAAEAER